MFKRVIKKVIFFSFIVTMYSSYAQNSSELKSDQSPLYLDPSQPTEKRIDDLMGRMTLEDKVYQMNQFVGLDHMKKGNPNDDKENNDAQDLCIEIPQLGTKHSLNISRCLGQVLPC